MLLNIQFLRCVAAMLVVVYHTSSHVRDSVGQLGWFFSLGEAVGFAGVDIFFVISGFIMSYTTHAVAGPQAAWSFARRRVARIYSGYWPFFLLALALYFWVNPPWLREADLLQSAFLWPANNLLIGVSWTLIFEMFFYLIYTLLVLSTSRHRGSIVFALLVGVTCWTAFSEVVREAYAPGNLESISLAEYYMLSPYLAEFLAGALLARYLRSQALRAGGIWLLAGCALFLAGSWFNNQLFHGNLEQGYFVVYRVLIFGVPSVLIVAGLMGLEQGGLRAPVAFSLLAGGASYALYLSHTLLLTLTQHLGLNTAMGAMGANQAGVVFFAYCVLILLINLLYFRYLENPLHHGFKRLLRVA